VVITNADGLAISIPASLSISNAPLWAWGLNSYGQLGNGTLSNTNRPVPMTNNVVAVAAGQRHSLFVKADGSLWATGDNYYGQLGNGTTDWSTNRPVLVNNGSLLTASLAKGPTAYHSLAIALVFNDLLLLTVIRTNSTVVVSYEGIPYCDYALDWATNLIPPIDWEPVITNTSDSNGWVGFTNDVSVSPQNYFRTRRP